MKIKVLTFAILTCFTFSACSNTKMNEEAYWQKSTIMNNTLDNGEQESENTVDITSDIWKEIDKKTADLDNDGITDNITTYWLKESNSTPKFKIAINSKEKIIEFDLRKSLAVNSVNLKELVNLDNGTKGILFKLNSEGELDNQDKENAPPYWFDHSFLVIGYQNNEITSILDGINQSYNLDNNYIVKYVGDYNVEFADKATNFNAKYTASLYKSADDGIKRLKSINENQSQGISKNYFEVKAKDENGDGVDEVVCSKYIPGLYHADLLGIIDYTFTLKNGKYSLSKESFRYDGESGLSVIKEMNIRD